MVQLSGCLLRPCGDQDIFLLVADNPVSMTVCFDLGKNIPHPLFCDSKDTNPQLFHAVSINTKTEVDLISP